MSAPGPQLHADGRHRCPWCGADPLYVAYHDDEWGRPLRDPGALFELLCLEGAQAGLSWLTVLRKRENYRRAFDGFDAARIARYTPAHKAALLQDPGIVRNRLKVDAFVDNARAFLAANEREGGFTALVWQFTDGRTLRNAPRTLAEVPASTPASDAMSRELKRLGFRFVGSTICYAFMQAAGMVDDHLVGCFAKGGERR
jgi:DNA-3-methyladenine glycosylase I